METDVQTLLSYPTVSLPSLSLLLSSGYAKCANHAACDIDALFVLLILAAELWWIRIINTTKNKLFKQLTKMDVNMYAKYSQWGK